MGQTTNYTILFQPNGVPSNTDFVCLHSNSVLYYRYVHRGTIGNNNTSIGSFYNSDPTSKRYCAYKVVANSGSSTNYRIKDVANNIKFYRLTNIDLDVWTAITGNQTLTQWHNFQTLFQSYINSGNAVEINALPSAFNFSIDSENVNTTESGKAAYTSTFSFYPIQDGNYAYAIIFCGDSDWFNHPITRNLSQSISNCTSDTSDGSITTLTPTTIVYTADTDCIFNSSSIVVSGSSYSVNYSSDNTIATVTLNADYQQSISISANAIPLPTTRTLTQNLNNCTSDTSDTSISTTATKTIVLTAATSYLFNSVTNPITITGATSSVSYSADNTSATIVIDVGYDNVVVNASCVLDGRQLTQNLTNCTSNTSDGAVSKGAITINLTANNISNVRHYGFHPDLTPVTINGATGTITWTDKKHISINIDAGATDFSITVSAVEFSYMNYGFYEPFNHAISSISETTPIVAGETYSLVITAEQGYYFVEPPELRYYEMASYGGSIRPITLTLTTEQTSEYKTVYSTTFTPTISCDTYPYEMYVYANGSVIPSNDKYGFIKIYNPSAAEMKQLANERFTTGAMSDTIDLGQYILNFIRLFVNVTQAQQEYITLGAHTTTVESYVIEDDIVETDCGTVQITPYFNNEMDYNNTYIRLYLPLIGMVDIDSVLVMGKTIHLIYKTNIINGDTLAIILDNSDDTIIQTYTCKACYSIPYLLNQSNDIHGDLEIDSNYLYGFTPFVEIQRDTSYNTSNIRATDNKFVLLSTLTGFHTVDIINCSIANNAIENEMVINQLREGVNF